MVLGKTKIKTIKNGFGALPIQRISVEESTKILRHAYENGFAFFDTARFYTDSEEKLGIALSDVRDNICIATKTMASNREEFRKDIETSLKMLRTDYIDLYQFHNPSFCPKPEDGTGLYEEMIKAREEGLIKYIGITNHRIHVANEAIDSGLYETLQFPFSYLATEREIELVKKCSEKDIGFIAMKALAGGLLNDSKIAYAFMTQYDVLPIWGIQKLSELEEFISYTDNPPLYEDYKQQIQEDKKVLSSDFCRGCGYCMPCPEGIEISTIARVSLMLRRAPARVYLTDEWKEEVSKVQNCTECNSCVELCPYGLDTPRLLRENYKDYMNFN